MPSQHEILFSGGAPPPAPPPPGALKEDTVHGGADGRVGGEKASPVKGVSPKSAAAPLRARWHQVRG